MCEFSIGCDPEMFLEDESGLKSSVGIVTGTKKNPLFLEDGVFVMQDNVAIEFGMPPAYSEDEWLNRLSKSYEMLEQWLPEHLRLNVVSAARFPETELQTDEACQFGCDPDFNAWTRRRNKPPSAVDTNFRSCGGHVHIGYVDKTPAVFLLKPMGKINTVRMCDAYLGVPSIILDNTPESKDRRNLYGKAGCYRETDYGIEYRTLSNFWLKEQAFQKFIYRATSDIMHNMTKDYLACAKWVGTIGRSIQHIINRGNVDAAKAFVLHALQDQGRFSKNTLTAFREAERLV